MKKFIMALCIAMVSVGAYAQKGEKAVGANLSYGSQISNIGIGVKGQYGLTDAIRVEGGFNYFMKKDFLKMWDVTVNAHYLIPVMENVKVYPIAGINYTNFGGGVEMGYDDEPDYGDWAKAKNSYGTQSEEEEMDGGSNGNIGVNLGGGVQYDLNSQWAVNFEVKYQLIKDFNQALVSVGVAYKF